MDFWDDETRERERYSHILAPQACWRDFLKPAGVFCEVFVLDSFNYWIPHILLAFTIEDFPSVVFVVNQIASIFPHHGGVLVLPERRCTAFCVYFSIDILMAADVHIHIHATLIRHDVSSHFLPNPKNIVLASTPPRTRSHPGSHAASSAHPITPQQQQTAAPSPLVIAFL
jgi:hypothetical protein